MGGMTEDEKAAFSARPYPKFINRLGIQHGFNLFYTGVWALCLLVPLFGGWRTAWGWGLHPYLCDWGYFIGVDWVHVGLPSGEAQTFIVSIGLFCSAYKVPRL